MVDERNADQRPRFFELAGDGDILAAGLQGTRRVVVHTDDRSSPVGDGISKDFPRVDEAVV